MDAIASGWQKIASANLQTLSDEDLQNVQTALNHQAQGRGIYRNVLKDGAYVSELRPGAEAKNIHAARQAISREWSRREKLDTQIQTAEERLQKTSRDYDSAVNRQRFGPRDPSRQFGLAIKTERARERYEKAQDKLRELKSKRNK